MQTPRGRGRFDTVLRSPWWTVAVVLGTVVFLAAAVGEVLVVAKSGAVSVRLVLGIVVFALLVIQIVLTVRPIPRARMRWASEESPQAFLAWTCAGGIAQSQLDDLARTFHGTCAVLSRRSSYLLRVSPGRLEVLAGALFGLSPRPVVRASIPLPATVGVRVAARSVRGLRFSATIEFDIVHDGQSHALNLPLLFNGSGLFYGPGLGATLPRADLEAEAAELRAVLDRAPEPA